MKLKAADIFDELGPLEEHEQKKFKVECNPITDVFIRGLEMMIEGYSEKYPDKYPYEGDVEKGVEEVCEGLPLPKYGARDVEAFSLMLSSEDYKTNFFEHYAGTWLNALIQRCPDEKITIHTYHLNVRLDRIGRGHKGKYLTINGDVGPRCGIDMKSGIIRVIGNARDHLGMAMEGGEIIVERNAVNFVGHRMKGGIIRVKGRLAYELGMDMEGGEIIVWGSTETFVGSNMKGGKITVEGVAGKAIGRGMQGGEIYLNGPYESIKHRGTSGGKIYHKGKLIVRDD